MRRGSQWNVALTGKECRKLDRARSSRPGMVDLGPGVQVGEILRRAIHILVGRVSAGRGSPTRIDARQATAAGAVTNNQAVSRQEPIRCVRVSLGVCTPGSIRTE